MATKNFSFKQLFSYFTAEKHLFFKQPKTVRAAFAFLFLSVFLYGLYYEWTAYLAGLVLIFLNFYVIWEHKGIRICKKPGWILWLLFFLCYFVTIIFAVDSGMALAGAVKMLVPALFLVLLFQFDREEIRFLWHAVPDSAVFMLLISIVLWAIPATREFVSSNERLGGFFQYANTLALYLLLGIVVLMQQKKFDLSKGLLVIFLAAGILLTGSRFVTVLAIAWFLYQCIAVKKYRKGILISGGIMLAAAVVYVLLSGNLENVGRLFTITSLPSTFYGRLLYWKDALGIIIKHPAGLGYSGYYYIQSSVQTGDYIVRLVHNDWLQILLDGGIQTFVCLIGGLILGLKKADKNQKILFAVIAVAGCFDFHQAYLSIFFLLLMTLNFEDKVFYSKTGPVYAAAGILFAAFCWLELSFLFDFFGDYPSAIKVFPGNTESRILYLQQTSDLEVAAEQANKIISQNDYVALAYHARATYEKETEDYYGMMRDLDKMLENSPYELASYETALSMYSESIQAVNQKGDKELFIALIEKALAIPEKIEAVINRTDALGWKIDDVPQLTLPANYMQYLTNLQQAVEKLK